MVAQCVKFHSQFFHQKGTFYAFNYTCVAKKKCATKVYKVIQNGKKIKSLTYGKHVDFTYIHCVDGCLLGNLGLLFSNHIVWMFVYWEMWVYYFLITVHLYAF